MHTIMTHKVTYRILFMIAAFALGLLIVYLLSITGSESQGPIHHLINQAETGVLNFEEEYIINQRNDQRRSRLSNFNAYNKRMTALKHPKIILLGASDKTDHESFETILNLEDSLQTTFPLIQIYNAWGSKEEEQFPKLAVETILKLGSIPVITWEPWLSDFDGQQYRNLPPAEARDKNGLTAIAQGLYDKYIIEWASQLKNIGQPVFIRFAHEMNDPYRYPWGPQNNKPADFVAAWKHVRSIFDSVGVDNAIWVWAPHTAYGYFDAFFPGDEYVDYTGVGILNFGNVVGWSKWWSFDDLFEKYYTKLDSFNKPIMITEFGSLESGGDRAEWFEDALKEIPQKYPSIKSILFFHYQDDKTITNKEVSWYFIRDKESKEAISNQLNNWPDSLKLNVK